MASKLFRNGTILTFDETTQSVKVLRNASLLVKDDKVAAIGENVDAPSNAETIDCTEKVLSPGFINTHSHMWQTAMRTLAPNTTLAEYFTSYSQFSPVIGSYSADDIYVSCLEGYLEGLNGGVTSFVEHCHCCWDIDAVKKAYEATVDGGARVYWCCSIEDREKCSSEDQIKYMRELNDRRQDKLVSLGLAWDGMSSANADSVQRMKKVIKWVAEYET